LEAAVGSSTARWPYPPLTPGFDPSALQPPMILTSFHVGPISALGGALEQLPGDVLVLHVSGAPRPRLRMLSVGPTQWDRAAAFAQAMRTLRRGGFVFLLADANVFPSTIEVTMFGRTTRLARGAFALSRLSGAPVVPLAGRWQGTCVEVVAGEPIVPGEEAVMAAATAAWLERFVRASPDEMGQAFARTFWGDD
jgi:lauroyl/myristoyl acyltransferase